MKTVLKYIFCAIVCYLIGSINPAYFFSKKRGFDIREKGSGNAGGSNAISIMGRRVGILTIIIDMLKAFTSVWTMKLLFPGLPSVYAVASVFCIIGHMFPFYMGFKGGKGLACLGGSVLAFSPAVFGIMIAFEIVLFVLTQYIALVAMTSAVIFPVVYFILTKDIAGLLLMIPVSVIIELKHVENAKRMIKGQEQKAFAVLFRKK